jgi:hypothetical protein
MDHIITTAQTVLRTTPLRWSALTLHLPADLLRAPAAPGEWSALECLQHLLDTERAVFPTRVKHLLAGEDFPAFDPDAQGTPPNPNAAPQDLAAEFAALRAASLDLLHTVTPDDLDHTARHAELGVVSLRELLHEWAGHDLMHTVQAEQALLQPLIAGCGPWQPYFAAHVAKKS